jgi:2,6-dihydroxypyridine 3-monooxygenase
LSGGLRACIVGGSLGGLTAAVLLRDLGWEVQVHERSPAALQSRGVGIVVHPVAVRYLVDNNIAPLDAVSVGADRLVYIDRAGTPVFIEDAPFHCTAWNTLYRALRGHLDGDRYHLGEALAGFEQDADGVEVRFANGRTERCDLLVCADGTSSTARSLLLPAVQPVYSGYVGWRGTVRDSAVSPETREAFRQTIIYHVMPASHILEYPIPAPDGGVAPGSRALNFVWYRNVSEGAALEHVMTDRDGNRRARSVPPGGVRDDVLAELRHASAELPPVLREVVEMSSNPFIQPVMDVEVPRMAFGRVCLMGDAAFTARPHAAAGTAKAAADAWALAAALEGKGVDVAAALREWEPGQLALGSELVERNRRMGERSQFLGTWYPEDTSLRFGLWGPGN